MDSSVPYFILHGISFVIWYFGSHLSSRIREKDYELIVTNYHLKESQIEKAEHFLRITHELKSPFAAIDAKLQLLLKGHCETISVKILEVLERISTRSRKLGYEIQQMLQHATLRSVNNKSLQRETLDLALILEWCIAQVKPTADKRELFLKRSCILLQCMQVLTTWKC